MEAELRKRVSLTNPWHFLGLGFGSGLIPLMPGTMGSIAALPLVLAVSMLAVEFYLAATLLACLIGIAICAKTADALKVHDHGAIVWDEVAGMLVTFILVPLNWQSALAGFVLFRFFDIVKPWPIRWLDKHVHGGFGIMIDDIIAGLMACGCLHVGLVYWPF